MQKITPFLWFDTQAEEAVHFYVSRFPNSKTGSVTRYPEGTPQQGGKVMTVDFSLGGVKFGALNGGPFFKLNPSISFFVNCTNEVEIDALWKSLSEGGKVLMELASYPFSAKYGRVEDKYGVSWQLFISEQAAPIRPCLMFTEKQYGKVQEALDLYTSIFSDSSIDFVSHYGEGEGDTKMINHAAFTLAGQGFIAMESNLEHGFSFNEAVSFVIHCDGQQEVDFYRNKLIADGGEESQCGWLKDKFGVSWQVVPKELMELMSDPDKDKANRATQAMMQMKKIDIAALEAAANKA